VRKWFIAICRKLFAITDRPLQPVEHAGQKIAHSPTSIEMLPKKMSYAERFQLALHRENRELPSYAMVVGKGSTKLHKGKNRGSSSNGAIAIGDRVDVGTTVQFQVRDAEAADEDLRALLAGAQGDAALLFTCNGRGRHLFAEPNHDAGLVDELLGAKPLAGAFCAGEIGPIGGRNFLHSFTASVAVLER
jgi:hypothetical protein